MKIKKIVIEGFDSIVGRMKYKFDRPGLNLILGENGVGKTQIFNALTWCLYGKLLKGKESGPWPWPNVLDETFKGTYVHLYLEGLQIIRCAEYTQKVQGIKGKNGLFVIDSNGLRPIKDKRGNQLFINKYLGYSFDLFKNSILFGQRLKRLLEEEGTKKKEIFDEAFESTFILRARDKVEERIKDLKFTYNGQKAEYDRYESLITNNRELLAHTVKEKIRWQKDHTKTIRSLKKRCNQNNEALKKYTENPNDLIKAAKELVVRHSSMVDQDLVGRELKMDFKKGQLLQDSVNKQKEIAKVKRISDYCGECGQILRGEAKEKHRQSKKSKLNKLRGEYKVIIDSLFSAREEHKELQAKVLNQGDYAMGLKKAQDNLSRIELRVSVYTILISDITNMAQSLEHQKHEKCPIKTNPIKAKIAEHLPLQEEVNKKMQGIQKKIQIDEWLMKEPLSNSGIKAFIFDSMLNKVNYYLKAYTKFIGFGVRVYMDLESANKDFKISILKGTQEVPYDELSGGQKQLADVALMFALNDTVTASKPINILLMDEVFESLSPNNVEVVGQIIEKKASGRSIHLITHQNFNPINAYKTFIKLIDPGHTVVDQKYKSA